MVCDCSDFACEKQHDKKWHNYCLDTGPIGYVCTRHKAHTGDHIAHSSGNALARWPKKNWKIAKDMAINFPITKSKDYGSECPCGIHPSQCSYHR